MASGHSVFTVLVTILLLLALGSYFLVNSLSLITQEPPRVAASLLAAVIGLSLVSAAVTLLRTWILSQKASEGPQSGVR